MGKLEKLIYETHRDDIAYTIIMDVGRMTNHLDFDTEKERSDWLLKNISNAISPDGFKRITVEF